MKRPGEDTLSRWQGNGAELEDLLHRGLLGVGLSKRGWEILHEAAEGKDMPCSMHMSQTSAWMLLQRPANEAC